MSERANGGGSGFGGVLLLASGATFLAFLDTTVVNVAFPNMHKDFTTTTVSTLSWVVSGYAVLFAALLTPAGRLADVWGRSRVFLASVGLFALASALCALAPTIEVLIAARIVQGVGAAGMIPAALAIVLIQAPPERRTAAVGIWAAAGSMASAAGPALGGLLVNWSSWRAVFLINVPIGLLIVLAGIRVLSRDQPTGRRLPDGVGALAVAIGIGLVVVGLSKGQDWGWAAPSTIACLAGGAVLTAFALLRSRSHAAPAIEVGLWRSRMFAVANVSSFLAGAALFSWTLSGPLYLTTVWHYSILQAGLAVTPGAFTSAIAAIITGRRATPRQQQVAVTGGMIVFAAVSIWMYAALGDTPEFLRIWLPAGLIGGAGLGAAFTGLAASVALSVNPLQFASGTGLNTTARQVGGAIGVAILAAILAAQGVLGALGYRQVWLFAGVAAVLAAISGLALVERRPASVPEPKSA